MSKSINEYKTGEIMKLSVCIPFYNEEAQVKLTLDTVRPILEGITEEFEIIVVDDGSSDKTWAIIETEALADSRIHAIRFSRNFGKEAAITAALAEVQGDAAVLMDGDLQHPPRYIPEMVRIWQEEGYDVVEGLKTARGSESRIRTTTAKMFYGAFERISNVDLDNASDFKLMDRKVVNAWNDLNEHNTFFRGLNAWLGFRRYQMPFVVDDRKFGETKWSLKSLWNLASNAVTSFSTAPLRLITNLGIVFVIVALAVGIITLVKYFAGTAVEGFTTVILLLLIIGGAIMISLGLIGTYIGKIYDEVKGRPRYINMEEINPDQFTDYAETTSVNRANAASVNKADATGVNRAEAPNVNKAE